MDVRWVASSFRAVKAVWNSYPVLHSHFCKSAYEPDIGSKARAEYSGLTKQLASSTFLRNLALMYDALQEIADLSESLQCNNMSLPRAHRLILRQIDVAYLGRKQAENVRQ